MGQGGVFFLPQGIQKKEAENPLKKSHKNLYQPRSHQLMN